MKRKFTTFIALVLSCMLAAPAFADLLSLTGTSDVVTEPKAGTYYVIQGNGQAGQITWLYDNNGTFAATAASSVPTGPEGMAYVWTFEVTAEGYAAKNFTTGRYIFIEGTSNGGAVKMRTEPFYFAIDVNGSEVGFKNSSDRYIDMGWSGTGPVTWNGGVNGSRRMSIMVAQVEEITEVAAAKGRLNNVFDKYSDYLPNYGSETIDRGTEIGQYNCSDEIYNAFISGMQQALAILSDEVPDVTAEMIDELIESIETAYQGILDSLVKLTIADGNYRIVSALEWTNTERIATGEVDENEQPIYEEIVTHPTKAMYATLPAVDDQGNSVEGKAMWAHIDSTDCRYLWQLTNNAETGLIKMMNIATDGILATCTQSTPATLAADSETEMLFQFIRRTKEGKIVVNMKPSTGNVYAFLHCNGHGGGTGKASSIVGWTADAEASQWILEPVSVEAYAPIKDHELLVTMFQNLIADTEAAIAQAQDLQYVTDRSEGLITDTLQFSSPYTETREGSSFANVLNDNVATFWHSNWSNNVPNHTHFFNVAFAEPITGDIQCFMRRRNVQNDHITSLGVFGTNDESILEATSEEGWTNLGSYNLSANASSSQTVYSNALDYGEGYKYIRFYIDGTTNNRGYGHFATFQLYRLTVNGNTQWSQMGDAAAAIDSALVHAKAVDLDELEITDYDALKAAYDAFKAVLCDPSALAAALANNKDITKLIVYGNDPGFWTQTSGDTSSPAFTIQLADDYLRGGAYTQEQLDTYTEAVTSIVTNLMASANPVEEGKWYAFRFDHEKNYDANHWNKSDAINETLGDLFDNYVAPANIEENVLVGFERLEDVTVGQPVRFINDEVIQQMDQIAFRFVAQGDSAFVIQHKSGLYLSGAARSTNLTLGLTPALFNVKAVGYGKVVIEARDLKGQRYFADAPVYLHAQNAGHSLVTWNDDAVSSKSALYIESIDVNVFDEGEDVAESTILNAKPNSFIFMCYPTAFSVEGADLYAYQGAFDAEKEKEDTTYAEMANYAFNKIEQAAAGQPVLLVVGDYESFEADDPDEEPEQIYITPLGSSFAIDPLTEGGIHGTYAYEWVDKGTVVVGGGEIAKAGCKLVLADGEDNTDCTRDISANTGYIVYGENILSNASVDDFDLVLKSGKPSIKGDVNGDNEVNIADAQRILIYIANGEAPAAADLNGDNEVNIADAQQVLIIIANQ